MIRSMKEVLRNFQTPPWICDNISIQGYSHKLNEKECQDASYSWTEKRYCGIIVCDGHGGEKYFRSAAGSKLACEIGYYAISAFMLEVSKEFKKGKKDLELFLAKHSMDAKLDRLQKAITIQWREAVAADITERPFAGDERFEALSDADRASLAIDNGIKAYGTTFVAGIMSQDFLFIIKLGDSNASIVLDDGSVIMPDELSDPQLQFNRTTSLCNSDADIQFRNYFMRIDDHNRPAALILSSDGVINCYHTEEAFKSFIKNISDAYAEECTEDAHGELEAALNTLSEKGSGDDLSIAVVRWAK